MVWLSKYFNAGELGLLPRANMTLGAPMIRMYDFYGNAARAFTAANMFSADSGLLVSR